LLGEFNHPPENESDVVGNVAWNQRCDDRLVALLSAMALTLRYPFTEEEIRRGTYFPKAKFDLEQARLGVLHGAQSVLEGITALKMKVVEIPTQPAPAANVEQTVARVRTG
jgi:hypothetical protein